MENEDEQLESETEDNEEGFHPTSTLMSEENPCVTVVP